MKCYIFISSIFLFSQVGFSQSFEFTIGAGVTAIDVEQLVEKDEIAGTTAEEWEVFNYGISGQYFLASRGSLMFGAELMYQYLYYYRVNVPFGEVDIFREYFVNAIKITPIVRFGINDSFAFDLGPEFNFMDGLSLGLLVSANYYIPISDKIDIPIKVRVDIINDIVITVPISLNVGMRIKM